MSRIHGVNRSLGERIESAGIMFLLAKKYWVKRTTITEDYHHKVDVLAISPRGTTYAIQIKSANIKMSDDEKKKLIEYAEKNGYEPRLILVRDFFRCHFKKIELEKEA